MRLGDELKSHAEKTGHDADALAAAWVDAWQKVEGDDTDPDTVRASLLQLLAGRVQGVEFFFADPVRTRLLMDVLEIPRDDWAPLREAATSALRRGGDPPRTVVDLARGWPVDERGLRSVLGELTVAVFAREALHPITVLVTPSSHDRIPKKLAADLAPGVAFVELADHDAVAAEIERLAPSALVVSREPVHPVDHWWAAAFDPNNGAPKLLLEPPDGAVRFVDEGALPGPGLVERSLADLGIEAVHARFPIPDDPASLRELVATLTDPAITRRLGEAPKRQALAEKLGIPAAATPAERIDAELALVGRSLGLEFRGLDRASLDSRLSRAEHVRVGPELWRVGDQLHLITPDATLAKPSEHLVVHHRPPPESAWEILNREIVGWTIEDWVEDRQLAEVAARLRPDGGNDREWDHARITLLFTVIPEPRVPVLDRDWAEALAAFLDDELPAVRLRLHVLGEPVTWCPAHPPGEAPVRPELQVAPFFVPGGSKPADRMLAWAPPVGPLEVDRGTPVTLVAGTERGLGWGGQKRDPGIPDYFVPFPPDGTPSVDHWYEAMAASRAVGAPIHHVSRYFEGDGARMRPAARCLPHPDEWQVEARPLLLSDELWTVADRLGGYAWLALRRSMETPSMTLHDGTGLLPLGGGVVATVRAWRRGESTDPMRVSLDARHSAKGKQPGLFRSAGGWRTGTLPVGMHLSGRGWHVDLAFETSALLGE